VLGIVATAALGVRLGWAVYRYGVVERAIAGFEASPSQVAAKRLGGLLDDRVPTNKQARRILELILRPEVTTRSGYPAGRIPTVRLEMPFRLRFHDSQVALEQQLWLEGQDTPSDSGLSIQGDLLDRPVNILAFGETPLKVGRYKARIRVKCTVAGLREHRTLGLARLLALLRGKTAWRGTLTKTIIGTYRHSIDVPVEVNVVDKYEAERIRLISDPNLERALREAFAFGTWDPWISRAILSGYPVKDRTIHIHHGQLGIPVAFDVRLRLPDGRLLAQRRSPPKRFRGASFQWFSLRLTDFTIDLDKPGLYDSTIVLEPNPDYAYEDPAIKEIWGGTLEFPISFTLTEGPPPDGQRELENGTERTMPPAERERP
jgi:hypothetical protein